MLPLVKVLCRQKEEVHCKRYCRCSTRVWGYTFMLSCSLSPSATVLPLLPLVLSPLELMPLRVGGPLCAC